MAPNRVSDAPPPISTSDEDITDSSSEEGSEESSPEASPAAVPPTAPVVKKYNSKKPESLPVPKPPIRSPNTDSQSSSDSSTNSGSSSENPPLSFNAPTSNAKPVALKPLDEKRIEVVPPKTKKSRSKPAVPASPARPSTATKRPIEDTSNAKDSKRLKKKVSDLTSDVAVEKSNEKIENSKNSSQRLWSNDDEIAILRAMVAFASMKGADASTDMNAFYDFGKGDIRSKFSRNQVSDKIKRLKRKFKNNTSKGEVLELSNKLWGGSDAAAPVEAEHVTGNVNIKRDSKASKAKESIAKVNAPPEVTELLESKARSRCLNELVAFNKNLSGLNLNEDVIKEGLELMGGSKKLELEEMWKKMLDADMVLYFKRLDLIIKSTEEILVALRSPKN